MVVPEYLLLLTCIIFVNFRIHEYRSPLTPKFCSVSYVISKNKSKKKKGRINSGGWRGTKGETGRVYIYIYILYINICVVIGGHGRP
jgi:hypothetical protein